MQDNAFNVPSVKNGWGAERRAAQAEKIRNWKPWEKSTGARTAQGRVISSRNADKGKKAMWAAIRAEVRVLKEAMKMQAEMLDRL